MKRIKPKPGQESVWDYPRPPAIESVTDPIQIILNGKVIFNGNTSYRILETSHPPTYYLPISDFKKGILVRTDKHSFCEFKGVAHYYHIQLGEKVSEFAAWGYDEPQTKYASIKNHVSLYASKMDKCFVSDEKVKAQEGDFYGGWITSKIVGPFKGGPGTWGW